MRCFLFQVGQFKRYRVLQSRRHFHSIHTSAEWDLNLPWRRIYTGHLTVSCGVNGCSGGEETYSYGKQKFVTVITKLRHWTVRFEVFMEMKIQVAAFWIVPPCSDVVGYQHPLSNPIHFQPEDGGSMVIRNVGILPRHCTASQLRRRRLKTSPPWKPQHKGKG
jgi:hypothetical protein